MRPPACKPAHLGKRALIGNHSAPYVAFRRSLVSGFATGRVVAATPAWRARGQCATGDGIPGAKSAQDLSLYLEEEMPYA